MFCCGNCFSDQFLNDHIEKETTLVGDCSFCERMNVDVIEPEELSVFMQQVVELYLEVNYDEDVQSIVDLLKWDWCLFKEIDNEGCFALLHAIFPEVDFRTKKYTRKIGLNAQPIFCWSSFRHELKHENRYFPQQAPDLEHLKNLLGFVVLPETEQPKVMYRARCNIPGKVFTKEEMEKPPKKNVAGGRANPLGIPYLYTASCPKTAIAEIRPHTGDTVSVAEFNVLEKLSFVDLRNPRETISPFMWTEDVLTRLHSDLVYLCHLGKELSVPVLPRDAHLEYLPTQYLCEFIKRCGYDGVVYRSAVGEGVNYAIFNDDKVKVAEDVSVYEVTEVSFKSILK